MRIVLSGRERERETERERERERERKREFFSLFLAFKYNDLVKHT